MFLMILSSWIEFEVHAEFPANSHDSFQAWIIWRIEKIIPIEGRTDKYRDWTQITLILLEQCRLLPNSRISRILRIDIKWAVFQPVIIKMQVMNPSACTTTSRIDRLDFVLFQRIRNGQSSSSRSSQPTGMNEPRFWILANLWAFYPGIVQFEILFMVIGFDFQARMWIHIRFWHFMGVQLLNKKKFKN